MDVFTTHGAFSWSELMTTDVAGAKSFYGSLFGWQFREMEMPNGTYTTCQVGETSVAGIMPRPDDTVPVCWGSYVTVRNLDETVKQVASLGGNVLTPPFDVPAVGRMAVIQDPQGGVLSVISYEAPTK